MPLYDTVRETLSDELLAEVAEADYVTFTSSSTVRYFVEAIGGADRFPARARVVSIGPITSRPRASSGWRCTSRRAATTSTGSSMLLVEDALSQRMAAERR